MMSFGLLSSPNPNTNRNDFFTCIGHLAPPLIRDSCDRSSVECEHGPRLILVRPHPLKPHVEVKEILYGRVEELDSMDNRALLMFLDEELRPGAMVHIIHSIMALRIPNVTSFQWEYFDFQTMTIQLRAKKNEGLVFPVLPNDLESPIELPTLNNYSINA